MIKWRTAKLVAIRERRQRIALRRLLRLARHEATTLDQALYLEWTQVEGAIGYHVVRAE